MTAPGRFLERWSRLKRQGEPAPAPAEPPVASPSAAEPAAGEPEPARAAGEAAPGSELPALETLGLESDFTSFLKNEVSEPLRRAALRKLFSDPHFNRMDGLDVYIDDYSIPDPIPPDMLERLRQVRTLLRDEVASEGATAPGETPPGETRPRAAEGAEGTEPAADGVGPAAEGVEPAAEAVPEKPAGSAAMPAGAAQSAAAPYEPTSPNCDTLGRGAQNVAGGSK
jgi:hypothetical protein